MIIMFGYRGVIFDDSGRSNLTCSRDGHLLINYYPNISNNGKTPINETRIFVYHDHQKLLHDTQKLFSYRGVMEGE